MKFFRYITPPRDQGFTLIELIVVISIISVLLAFSLPRLDASFFSDKDRKISTWILLKVKLLKEQAVQEQTLFVLNVDLDEGTMWTSAGPMTDETPKTDEFKVPSGFEIMDVAVPGDDPNDDKKVSRGVAEINFYRQGYSDKAIIHLRDRDNNQFSYLIEPFLPHVKIVEEYVGF